MIQITFTVTLPVNGSTVMNYKVPANQVAGELRTIHRMSLNPMISGISNVTFKSVKSIF